MGFFSKLFNGNKERSRALKSLAFQLGFQFKSEDDFGLVKQLENFKLFKIGGAKKAKNLIILKDVDKNFDLKMFDYSYTISTGKSTAVYTQTVFFVESKNLGLPEFYMKPEGFFAKIEKWFTSNDINFDFNPTFSEKYLLTSENEEYLRSQFDEKVLSVFNFKDDWHFEGINYYMLLYKNNKVLKPEEIEEMYGIGKKLYNYLRME